MIETATTPSRCLKRMVSLRSYSDVMRFGVEQGWTNEQVIRACRNRFGRRISCGIKSLIYSYEYMRQQANDKLSEPAQ